MTDVDAERLRLLCDQATPGPWEEYDAPCCPDMGGVTTGARRVVEACVGRYGHPMSIQDAAFIATARTAVPVLLDENDRLKREVQEVRGEVERLTGALDAGLLTPAGHEKLIDVMQRRYGREARQWQANHDERKAERDAARAECERLRAERDAMIYGDTVDAAVVITERQTAEAIAAWLDASLGAFRSVRGTDRDEHNRLLADIRSGAWRKGES